MEKVMQTIVEVDGTATYYGEAQPGTAKSSQNWQIRKALVTGGVTETYFPVGEKSDGYPTSSYSFKWDDRKVLTYMDGRDVTAATLSTVTIASDNTTPTLAKVGDEITLTIIATEALKTISATIEGEEATIVAGADDAHYTATYTMVSGDTEGVIDFTIDFTDNAGNAGVQVTAVTGGSGVTFDKTAPTALLEYSIDAGASYASTISVKNADTLRIRATFSEALADSPVVKLAIDNSILSATAMTKTDTTHYYYDLNVPAGDIAVATCSLSIGTDPTGNVITATPTAGATFSVDNTLPTLASVTETNVTTLNVVLSELALTASITKANDGGFVVYETGTPATTYAVSAIAPGLDNTHVILTVADMTASAIPGVTVTYVAAVNGTVSDLAGNLLATNAVGVVTGAF